MNIGEKIKQRRITYGLTQEELAVRTDLSKGFISQVERDITSPSIATLVDILEALGTSLCDFFNDERPEKIVFGDEDVFEKDYEEQGLSIKWLITSAQKNAMEPILITLQPGAETAVHEPHEGEEFAHVLQGSVQLTLGNAVFRIKRGASCYYNADSAHCIKNIGQRVATVLWVSSPPSF